MFYATEVIEEVQPTAKARTVMKVNGFRASLKRAPKLVDNGFAHQLPHGEDIPVFPVDMLPGCPEDWVREPGSYVCPVDPEWGLWFDWTMNDRMNTAVLPTVKGMNPITGQKLDGLVLEEYKQKCPVHKKDFQGDERFCEECGYKWPPQSYVCSPNHLWWDGFRQPDGTVRQFFFSEDEARDIASAVIGKKSTVPAFGFAFFQPVEARPAFQPGRIVVEGGTPSWLGGDEELIGSNQGYIGSTVLFGDPYGVSGASGHSGASGTKGPSVTTNCTNEDSLDELMAIADEGEEKTSGGIKLPDESGDKQIWMNLKHNQVMSTQSLSAKMDLDYEEEAERLREEAKQWPNKAKVIQPEFSLPNRKGRMRARVEGARRVGRAATRKAVRDSRPVKNVAVGGGAMIRQDLAPDTLSATDWKSESAGVIRLYFCFKPQFENIVNNGGIKDLDGDKEGFMKGLPTG
jgi:hypothetical protein